MELYKGQAGSPITYLASDISAVADDSALPNAPNIATIGFGENIETVKYGQKSNGVLQEVVRGVEGIPRAWQAGTEVARFFTAYDHNSIIDEFNSHLAENVSQVGGVHGLEVETGTFTPFFVGSAGGNPAMAVQTGQYYKIGICAHPSNNVKQRWSYRRCIY